MDVTVLGEKDFQTDEPIGWAQFLNKESVSKFILGQDKHDDKQGYIQLYLELILNETKRKVTILHLLRRFCPRVKFVSFRKALNAKHWLTVTSSWTSVLS